MNIREALEEALQETDWRSDTRAVAILDFMGLDGDLPLEAYQLIGVADTYEIVGDDGKPVAVQQVVTPWGCCGSTTDEHHPDCPDRCRHCGSEGSDLDHKEGCPTIGTCAQIYPNQIDLADAHPDPDDTESWAAWHGEHMRTFHPGVRYWG